MHEGRLLRFPCLLWSQILWRIYIPLALAKKDFFSSMLLLPTVLPKVIAHFIPRLVDSIVQCGKFFLVSFASFLSFSCRPAYSLCLLFVLFAIVFRVLSPLLLSMYVLYVQLVLCVCMCMRVCMCMISGEMSLFWEKRREESCCCVACPLPPPYPLVCLFLFFQVAVRRMREPQGILNTGKKATKGCQCKTIGKRQAR
jgi:hypothetical protein